MGSDPQGLTPSKSRRIPREADPPWSDATRKLHAAWWEARIERQRRIDASIAKAADVEYLYDRPYVDNSRVRVAGPFTVESLSPHRVVPSEADELADTLAAQAGKRRRSIHVTPPTDFADMVLDHLTTAGVTQVEKRDTIRFAGRPSGWPGEYICAEAHFLEGGRERRAGILVGPEYGTLSRGDLTAAAREANDARFDALIACAFAFDAHAAELNKLGPLPILKAKMNPDLHMAGELKNTGKGNLFVVFGEPDIDILDQGDDTIALKINGIDVFDPNTGDIRSGDTRSIAAWFIDTDYNAESFFVRHAYFLGANDPYKALKTALRAEIDEDAWATLYRDTSRPFPRPKEGRIAVKVINHFGDVVPRIRVASFLGIARELYELIHGRQPAIAGADLVKSLLTKAAATAGGAPPISERFLHSEWANAVDAWQVTSAEGYAAVPRLGRKSRMGNKQRDRLWPIFETVQRQIAQRGLLTEAGVFRAVAEHYQGKDVKPFDNIVVDEAQDLGVPEFRFLAAIASAAPDALFFTGDLGQRIFQQTFSWKTLGVDVHGRSITLNVNYRTSHQIRETADRLIPGPVSDADGESDDRNRAISVFNGPEPIVVLADNKDAETRVVADFIRSVIGEGVALEEIAVFARTREVMVRAREAVKAAGCTPFELTLHKEGPAGEVRVGVMHLAKGLEFKAVAVIACDEDQLPLRSRIEVVADEVELDDVYATERHLFYVACTRARDRLLVSGLKPGSEFLGDLRVQ